MKQGPSWPILIGGLLLVAALVLPLAIGFQFDPHEIKSPLVGKPAPAFALARLSDGATIRSDELVGKPVVLNFWATWCQSCPLEHPGLVQASRFYGDRVQFVGVAYEDKREALRGWLQRYGGEAYDTLIDVGGKVAIAFGVYGVPETYIIDAQGVIRYKHVGPIAPATLRQEVERVL